MITRWLAAISFTLLLLPSSAHAISLAQSAVGACDSGTTCTQGWSGAPTSGQLMIATVFTRSGAEPTPPSGWSECIVATNTINSDFTGVWYKVAGASEPDSVTFADIVAGEVTILGISSWDGMDQVTPCDVAATTPNGAQTSVETVSTGTTINSTLASTLNVVAAALRLNVTSPTWSGSYTTLHNLFDDGTGGTQPTELFTGYKIDTAVSPKTSTASWTGATTAQGVITVFKGASGDGIPPTDPGSLVATAITSSTITLSCGASSDASGIANTRFERSLTGAVGSYSEFGAPAGTTFSDVNLIANTQYWYRCRAFDGTQFSNYATTGPITTRTLQSRLIEWNDNSPDAASATAENRFILQCCEWGASASCSNFFNVTTTAANVESFQWTTAPNPSFTCRVRAQADNGGDSVNSNAESFTASSPATLSVAPPNLNFSAQIGGPNPTEQAFTIGTGADQTQTWTISDNAGWVSVAPSSGTGAMQITVTINTAGLTSGNHNATITVNAPGATNTPQTVAVSLSLSPADAPGGSVPGRGFGGRTR